MATLACKSLALVLAVCSVCCAADPDPRCPDPNSCFSECGDINPITCANKDKLRITAGGCLSSGGCVCKDGYVRNYNGLCILPENCPVCGSDEVFKCGPVCDITCETLVDDCLFNDAPCIERCYCIDGYARNASDICIPIKQCPAKECPGKNERYNLCPPLSPELTCETYFAGNMFSSPFDPETRICKPRCECRDGYVREVDNGECISILQCTKLPKIIEE